MGTAGNRGSANRIAEVVYDASIGLWGYQHLRKGERREIERVIQTDRQTDNQTDRERERERETGRYDMIITCYLSKAFQ